MPRSIGDHFRLIVSGIFAIGVMLMLVGGLAWIAGQGRAVNPAYRLVGATFFVIATLIMFYTARHWARFFIGLCLLAAGQAVFALLTGHTLSQPSAVVTRAYAFAVLAILAGLAFFSARFATEPPKSRLDSMVLVIAVAGLLGSMLTEPDVWPLLLALLALGGAWVTTRRDGLRS